MDWYERLRPYNEDQPCTCVTITHLLLVHILTANPIRCFECKGYVDPDRLNLSEPQVSAVAVWDGVFGALYRLWLDSAQYEDWAEQQLLDPEGRVNVLGLQAKSTLDETLPTDYWWFHHEDLIDPTSCPKCSSVLTAATRHGKYRCASCAITI